MNQGFCTMKGLAVKLTRRNMLKTSAVVAASHRLWGSATARTAASEVKYNVLVQDGAEQRSNPCAQAAAKFLAEGGLGEVYLSKGMCYKWRSTIGKTPDEPVPAGVHYDLWLGPAPKRPFNRNRFHSNWHWNWDNGNGDMENQGIHEMDVSHWQVFLGQDRRPGPTGEGEGNHYKVFTDAMLSREYRKPFVVPDKV
jgi:hypothetical protein